MAEPTKPESVTTGSSDDVQKADPSVAPAPQGQSEKKSEVNLNDYVPKKQYEELHSKFGEQGEEVGEYRKFFNEVSPLLDQLQSNQDLVDAIMAGKIDSKIVKAIMDDKFQIVEEASKIAKKEAQAEIKEELGTKKMKELSQDEINELVSKRVDEKMTEARKDLESNINRLEETREFENKVSTFIDNTPDFVEYADKVSEWLKDHPELSDIETAYLAVKGKVLAEKDKKSAEEAAAEEAKNVAANAAGGQSQSTALQESGDLFDKYIAPRVNPNRL